MKLYGKCTQDWVEAGWNMMAHAQKPDFVFRRNRQVCLNRRGASVQWTAGSRDARISSSNAGHTMFRGSVKGTGYPLHSPVSPSLPLQFVTVCHHISTGLYDEAFCICFKNVCSDWSYGYAPSTVNVFEKGVTLPGRSEVDSAVTVLCRPQLCAVLKGCGGGKLAFLCNAFM